MHPSQVRGEDVVMGARFIARVDRAVSPDFWRSVAIDWEEGKLASILGADLANFLVAGQDVSVELDVESAERLRTWVAAKHGRVGSPPFPITFEKVKAKIGRRSQDRKRWTMPLWVTDEERARIVEAARRSGRPVSAYARDASLHLPEGAVLPPYSRNGDDGAAEIEPEADVAS